MYDPGILRRAICLETLHEPKGYWLRNTVEFMKNSFESTEPNVIRLIELKQNISRADKAQNCGFLRIKWTSKPCETIT